MWLLLTLTVWLAAARELRVVPQPRSVQFRTAPPFRLVGRVRLALKPRADALLRSVGERFLRRLRARCGDLELATSALPSNDARTIELVVGTAAVPRVPLWPADPVAGANHSAAEPHVYPDLGVDESYSVAVDAERVRVDAPSVFGVRHALETLLQAVESDAQSFVWPAVAVRDAPRFAWRGLLLDVVRHWVPLATVLRVVDGMAAAKLNVLHLHLTDDQGFRVFAPSLPHLAQRGARRAGEFYSVRDVRRLVRYAAERGVRVVPEFNMPAHCGAWLYAEPSLAVDGQRVERPVTALGEWHEHVLDISKKLTWSHLEQFFDDMRELFPDRFWHTGGDEPDFKQWRESADVDALADRLGASDNAKLLLYFSARVRNMLAVRGKRMIAWEESLQHAKADDSLRMPLPETAPPLSLVPEFAGDPQARNASRTEPLADVVQQSWLGPDGVATANYRHQPLLHSTPFYLDFNRPIAAHYADVLVEEQPPNVLGGEAAMWTEWVSAESLEGRLWPRLAAVAERLWSERERRDMLSLVERLVYFDAELERLGAQHAHNRRVALARLAGGRYEPALGDLCDAVKPLQMYPWHGTVNQTTPFVRLEHVVGGGASLAAELFVQRVDAFVSAVQKRVGARTGQTDAAGIDTPLPYVDELREALTRWRSQHAPIARLVRNEPSHINADLAVFALRTARSAIVGEVALDALVSRANGMSVHCNDTWMRTGHLALEEAKRPHSRLYCHIAVPIALLHRSYCRQLRYHYKESDQHNANYRRGSG